MSGRPLGLLRRGLGALAPSPVHRYDRDKTIGRGERHCCADCGSLECRSTVDQVGFQGLAEVLDEMKPVNHLDSVGPSAADAIRIQVTAIATDDGDRRMLGEPCRH
jgi:hypothetical protein